MNMRHKVRVLVVMAAVTVAILRSDNVLLSIVSIIILAMFLVVSLLTERKINEV